MDKPCIMGVGSPAMIGKNKIIFCMNQSPTMNVDYDYVVFTYSEDFTFTVKEQDCTEINYRKEPLANNYSFDYRYSQKQSKVVIRLYENNDTTEELTKKMGYNFQMGDYYVDEIVLSNGDVLFNNFGDVASGLLFTINNPSVSLYTKNQHAKKFDEEDYEYVSKLSSKNLHYDQAVIEKYLKKKVKMCNVTATDDKFFIY